MSKVKGYRIKITDKDYLENNGHLDDGWNHFMNDILTDNMSLFQDAAIDYAFNEGPYYVNNLLTGAFEKSFDVVRLADVTENDRTIYNHTIKDIELEFTYELEKVYA